MKISLGWIYNRIKKYPKVKKLKEKRGRRAVKKVDKEKLFKLRKKGKTMEEIAKELKVSVGTVYNRLRETREK